MSTHKHIDQICVAIIVLALLLTALFLNGEALGITASPRSMGYENTLFDTSKVHTIDILIDDWDSFLDTATSEEYAVCNLVIDSDVVKNVAIRGKGNTSLSSVASMGSDRYSFKLEFDHFENGKTYQGLDKLCLNNVIQDNTYMKDYLAYRLMAEFGVDTPLCSYVWVTVNGEAWGLYLAVEAVEDSFMTRVYNGEGDLYKPDSMSMGGGGPGNGRDFNIEDFMDENAETMGIPWARRADNEDSTEMQPVENQMENGGSFPQPPGDAGESWPQLQDQNFESVDESSSRRGRSEGGGRPDMGGGPGMPGGGMGSGDVKLKYTDNDPDSYSNIFNNAKTDLTNADRTRLIRSLEVLSTGENLEDVLDIDEVLRYFVVHNFLVNSDSYTGAMVHNYYLREANGRFSMIPWDYNLAFGTFQASDASGAVNDPIDTPLSVSGDGSRPMVDWIFQNEEYTDLYHQYFAEFLDEIDISCMIDETYALISPYVEKDPSAFCTYDEFESGVSTLRSFCEKRIESVRGQLDGIIPSTDAGQQEDSSSLIDASDLSLSEMGSMGGGKGSPGGFFGGGPGGGQSDGGTQSGQGFSFPGSGFGGEGGFQFPAEVDTSDFQPPADMDNGLSLPAGMDNGGFQPPSGMDNGGFQPPSMSENGSGASESAPGSFTPGGTPGMAFPSQAESTDISWTPILLSAAVLVFGLLAAFLYKKRS